MMKKTSIFLLSIIAPSVAFGGLSGSVDKRKVVGWWDPYKPSYVDKDTQNQWNTDKYNKIVFVTRDDADGLSYLGSGSFISPRHILTNRHVVTDKSTTALGQKCGQNGKTKCKVYLSNDTHFEAKTILHGSNTGGFATDWAILEIVDENYCNKNYYDEYVSSAVNGGLWHAGFGGLRVLTDDDIKNIKLAYLELLNAKWGNYTGDERDRLVERDYSEGVDVGFAHNKVIFVDKFKELTGEDFADYLDDDYTLKYIEDCAIKKIDSDDLVQHVCYGWHGDSGSPIIKNYGGKNKIISIVAGGSDYIAAPLTDYEIGVKTQNIFNIDVLRQIAAAKQKCGVSSGTANIPGSHEPSGGGNSGTSPRVIPVTGSGTSSGGNSGTSPRVIPVTGSGSSSGGNSGTSPRVIPVTGSGTSSGSNSGSSPRVIRVSGTNS